MEHLGNTIDFEKSIDMMPDCYLAQQWSAEYDGLPKAIVSEQTFNSEGLLGLAHTEVHEIRSKARVEDLRDDVPLEFSPTEGEEFMGA